MSAAVMPIKPFSSGRPLRVAVIAHLRYPIVEPFMGGMEAHADLLVRGLRAAGHEPILFSTQNSDADLPLWPVAPHGYENVLPWSAWRDTARLRAWLGSAYQRAWKAIRSGRFDVIHNNSLFDDIHRWVARDRMPTVTTLHVPPFERLSNALVSDRPGWHRLTVPSQDQQRIWYDATGVTATVAHNGIDLARWSYSPNGGSRAIWFGRITPTKGTSEALMAATAAGIGVDVAGPIDDAAYFRDLEPLLGGQHRYVGHLRGSDLSKAVATAAVAICTPLWDEPFGLVAAEALACGTPVAALARGAMTEVVGDAGVLVGTLAELPEAIRRAATMPRSRCRLRAETQFSASAMVSRYEDSYNEAIAAASSLSRTRAELA